MQAAPTTTDLFRAALDTVQATEMPSDLPPTYIFPSLRQPTPSTISEPIEGLAGDLTATATAIREGSQGKYDALERALDAIAAFASRFGALEHLAPAEQLFATPVVPGPGQPLAGIPLTVKDIIDVGGMPTTGSSGALDRIAPPGDAVAVRRLREAGAIVVGKATTHEFAMGVTTPQSHNPWDESRVPGGSSGGSVISLVTGMALGSLGTDTRAPIRVPPALSGAVGFKPSLGVVPTDRWLTLSWTMDHFAPMARSVRDIALMMDVLAGSSRFSQALPATLNGLRFTTSDAFLSGAEPGVLDAFTNLSAEMERAGASVSLRDCPSPDDLRLANAAGMIISRVEAAQFHREMGTRVDACSGDVRDQLIAAAAVDATDMVRAFRLRTQLRERLMLPFESADLLLMPTTKVVAPPREKAND